MPEKYIRRQLPQNYDAGKVNTELAAIQRALTALEAQIAAAGSTQVPIWNMTLADDQTIGTGQRSVIWGTLTIPAGVTLTISGGDVRILAIPYGFQ